MARKTAQTRKRVTFNLDKKDWLTIQRIHRIHRRDHPGENLTLDSALHDLLSLARLIMRKERDGYLLAFMRGNHYKHIVSPFNPSRPFGAWGEEFESLFCFPKRDEPLNLGDDLPSDP